MKLLIVTQKVDQDDQLLGFFIEWLREFAKHFEVINIICLKKGKFDLPNNVRVHSLGKDAGLPKYRWILNFYKYSWQLRHEYDSVFVHMNPIWVIVGWKLWFVLRKKIVLWYTHKAVTLKLRLAEKLADTIATASKESFRLSSKKVVITGHGIDTDTFKPDPVHAADDGLLKILSVGRIAPVKNYEVLIEAANILKSSGDKFIITIIGEPALAKDVEYQAKIKSQISKLGLESNFNFIQKILHRELPAYYQNNKIFVHMSQTGSLDKTVLEAMSCGLSILSSNDAARGFLPKEWMFSPIDAAGLASKIRNPHAMDFNPRQYVIDNHDLKKLIKKLSSLL